MENLKRREFLKDSLLASSGIIWAKEFDLLESLAKPKMKLGLVTYLWGKDMDIPTLIKSCTTSKLGGVELRVDHAHGVHLGMTKSELDYVKSQFADSPVELIGMGTNEEYDSPDQNILKANINRTREWIRLSQAIGGSGVKVKPNKFHKGIPRDETLEQIGRSLNELGEFAKDFGQFIRLEVHGTGTQELPNIKKIMDFVPSSNVGVCWNCNPEDLMGAGLEYNFNLVKDRFGDTVHVRELDSDDYPYADLMKLFKKMEYSGWILLECRTNPHDKIGAMKEQRKIFKRMA